jgi:hypothetical protein
VNLAECIWIVRLCGNAAVCGSAAVCGGAGYSLRQCARWCARSARSSVAVRLVVYDSVRGNVWQCVAVRQCAAVQSAVCGSAHGSVPAVRAALCGSALGSIWQCARQCAAVRQYSSSGAQSARQCACCVRQCARQCTVVCGSAHSARGIVRQCAW